MVVGYHLYVEHIRDLINSQRVITSGMMGEEQRCRAALEQAQNGHTVALISSGDAGMYGMAGLAMEMAAAEGFALEMEVVPGVTAACSAAALLGAPLMLDSATISLSDLLIPWQTIVRRLRAVAEADLVVALYNPRSRKRIHQLEDAVAILSARRSGATPTAVVTAIGSPDERVVLCTLATLLEQEITMRSIVIVGNSTTCVIDGRMVTPRGYYNR